MLPGTLYGAYVHDVRCIRRGTGRVLTLARYALARECAHTYHVLGSFDLLTDTRRVKVWLARDHVRLKERESMTRERKRERAQQRVRCIYYNLSMDSDNTKLIRMHRPICIHNLHALN